MQAGESRTGRQAVRGARSHAGKKEGPTGGEGEERGRQPAVEEGAGRNGDRGVQAALCQTHSSFLNKNFLTAK